MGCGTIFFDKREENLLWLLVSITYLLSTVSKYNITIHFRQVVLIDL